MSKRTVPKYTILNSSELETNIKEQFNSIIKNIWGFTLDQSGNNKSSGKTDYLHHGWGKIFTDCFGRYDDTFNSNFTLIIEKEKINTNITNQINSITDIYGLKFKVDMVLEYEGKPHTVFLLKAPMTSINKNRFNSCSNQFGEINRFYGNIKNSGIKLVFINLTPKQTFTTHKNSIKPETVDYLGLNTIIKDGDEETTVLEKSIISENIKRNVSEIHIEYSLSLNTPLEKITDYSMAKNELNNTKTPITLNNGSLSELKKYIQKFIEENEKILNIPF